MRWVCVPFITIIIIIIIINVLRRLQANRFERGGCRDLRLSN